MINFNKEIEKLKSIYSGKSLIKNIIKYILYYIILSNVYSFFMSDKLKNLKKAIDNKDIQYITSKIYNIGLYERTELFLYSIKTKNNDISDYLFTLNMNTIFTLFSFKYKNNALIKELIKQNNFNYLDILSRFISINLDILLYTMNNSTKEMVEQILKFHIINTGNFDLYKDVIKRAIILNYKNVFYKLLNNIRVDNDFLNECIILTFNKINNDITKNDYDIIKELLSNITNITIHTISYAASQESSSLLILLLQSRWTSNYNIEFVKNSMEVIPEHNKIILERYRSNVPIDVIELPFVSELNTEYTKLELNEIINTYKINPFVLEVLICKGYTTAVINWIKHKNKINLSLNNYLAVRVSCDYNNNIIENLFKYDLIPSYLFYENPKFKHLKSIYDNKLPINIVQNIFEYL